MLIEVNQQRLSEAQSNPIAALKLCQEMCCQADGTALTAAVKPGENVQLSIVVPLFNEQENLQELISRLFPILDDLSCSFEIIFVNDGSTDQTSELLDTICRSNPKVVAIELARNFGHQTALTAGLELSCGEAVIVMDADMQDPPEAIPTLVEKWKAGADVVYAIRINRKESFFKIFFYKTFYKLLRSVASVEIPLDAGDFGLMSRRVVDLLNSMPERTRFVRGLRSWVGFNQVGIEIERNARFAGSSKYSLRRLIHLAIEGLVSFSYLPLRLISIIGVGVSFFSLLLAVMYGIQKLLYGLSPPGFATLVVMICFFSGVQLVTLGVIGEYVGHVFEEVKRRPRYVVKRISR